MEKVEEKLNNLQKELTNLIGYFSHVPKETYSAGLNKQESQAQIEPAASPAAIQGGPSMILHCKQWGDFQGLAMYAQMLTFRIKEDEKVLQADAIKGKQIVMFTGDLPNLSLILKTWLSKQLETPEKNIVEGFLEKSK